MRKKIWLGWLLFGSLLAAEEKVWETVKENGQNEVENNIYTRTCIPCHEHLPSSLEHIFMSYLKVYSGKLTVKESIKAYLRNPDPDMSVMSELFIDRFGMHSPMDLSEEELEETVNIYWNKYDVRNKLK